MKILFLLLSLLSLLMPANAQNKRALAKSDSLFARGVDLYKAGQYEDAIPLFQESDLIDKTELDSTSKRRDYSAMWLASCYYRSGDIVKATSISPDFYKLEPVDRRMTIKSDSLIMLAESMGHIPDRIRLLKETAKEESQNLGRIHYFRANSLLNIALFESLEGDSINLRKTITELGYVAQNNRTWRGNGGLLMFIFSSLLQHCDAKGIDLLLDELTIIVEPTKSDSANTALDGIWSVLIERKINEMMSRGEYAAAVQFAEKQYLMLKKANVVNGNFFTITSKLANTLFSFSFYDTDENRKKEMYDYRVRLYKEMLVIAQKLYGEKSFQYGATLYKVANLYAGLGLKIDKKKGKEYLHQAFDILTDTVVCLQNFDDMITLTESAFGEFSLVGDTESYLSYLDRVLNMAPENTELSKLQENRASILRSLSRYDEAIEVFDNLISTMDINQSPQRIIGYYQGRAFCYQLSHRLEEAIRDFQFCDSIYNKMKLDKDIEIMNGYSDLLNELSKCYIKIGDTTNWSIYNSRYVLMKEDIIHSLIKEKSYFQVQTIIEIIQEYGSQCYFGYYLKSSLDKNLHKAKKYLLLSLQFAEQSKITKSLKNEYALRAYSNIGRMYVYEQNFDSAYYYINQVFARTTTDNTMYYHRVGLDLMADLYERVSVEPELSLKYRYESVKYQSEELLKRRNSMLEAELITGYDKMRSNWKKCAEHFNYLADNEDEFECYKQLLYYVEKIKGKQSSEYVYEWISVLGCKLNYYTWTKPDKSICQQLCDSIVFVFEENRDLLKKYPFITYMDLGRNYWFSCKDTVEAEKYLKEYEKEIVQAHPADYFLEKDYISIQQMRTDFLDGDDKIVKLKEYEQFYASMSTLKDMYSDVLYDISLELKKKGNIEGSIGYLERFQLLNPSNVYTKLELIEYYLMIGDYKKILPLFPDVSENMKSKILNEFRNSSADKRERIWRSYSEVPFSLGEALAEKFPNQVPIGCLYDNILMRKNLLLNTSISSVNLIKTEGDSLLLAKYNRSIDLRNALLESKSDEIFNEGRSLSRSQAEKLVDRFNNEIMERAAIIGDYTKDLLCKWKEVQAHLGPEEIAIEFTCYQSFGKETSYAAVLLRNIGEPFFVHLFKEDELMNMSKDDYYKTVALGQKIWKPFEKELESVKNIYFSPDGLLHHIAIENVPYDNAGFPICDRWNLHRLSSTKQLVSAKNIKIDKASVYGGLKYSADGQVLINDKKKYPAKRDLDIISIADSLNLRSGVEELPATKIEAVNIDKALMQVKVTNLLYTDTLGTEASFKALSGQKRNLLHIATHGFYWTEREAQSMDHLEFLSFDNSSSQPRYVEDKAMTRSGLLFAGANYALKGKRLPEDVDDGILTAKEISTLDLRGLDIVVLSACQTGLGEISGDGVFGLQRGFKKAGANTLLMSLWKVDDNATQMLMTQFYANLTSGKSKFESLRDAQRYVREYEVEVTESDDDLTSYQRYQERKENDRKEVQLTIRKIKPYASPKYWAAFILLDAIN